MKQARCRKDNSVGKAWMTHGLQVVKGADKTTVFGRIDAESEVCAKALEQIETAYTAGTSALYLNVTGY